MHKITENDWVERIQKLLQHKADLPRNINIATHRRLPYSLEMTECSADLTPKIRRLSFETDLLIYEQNGDVIKPRIVIEAKLGIGSHDAITYSYKAQQHKTVIPYLRYGIILGNRKQRSLPGRLFRHGGNFDFMINFKKYSLDRIERAAFIRLLQKELRFSRQIESLLFDSQKKGRKRYFIMQKGLRLGG